MKYGVARDSYEEELALKVRKLKEYSCDDPLTQTPSYLGRGFGRLLERRAVKRNNYFMSAVIKNELGDSLY